MSYKPKRLSKIAKEFSVGISTIVDYLETKGHTVESNPNFKVPEEMYKHILEEYSEYSDVKKESQEIQIGREKKQSLSIEDIESDSEKDTEQDEITTEEKEDVVLIKDVTAGEEEEKKDVGIKVVGKIDLDKKKEIVSEEEPEELVEEEVEEVEEQEEVVADVEEEPEKLVEEETVEESVEEKLVEEEVIDEDMEEVVEKQPEEQQGEDKKEPKVLGKIDLSTINQKTRPAKKTKKQKEEERKERALQKARDRKKQVEEQIVQEKKAEVEKAHSEELKGKTEAEKEEFIKTKFKKLSGPTVLGKIEIEKKRKPVDKKKPVASSTDDENTLKNKKKKRKRIKKVGGVDYDKQIRKDDDNKHAPKKDKRKRKGTRYEVDEGDVDKSIKDTMSRLSGNKGKSKAAKYRRDKRDAQSLRHQEVLDKEEAERTVLKVTEFVTVAELASMMNVQATQVIATCMNLGLFVSINQRLDAEAMSLVVEEFGFTVEFVDAEVIESIDDDQEDNPEDMIERPPIVTVMGHVDHGKTKLLDYIRKENVIAGEAGGITQHIGAYSVQLDNGKIISFLDTPGHEAFTAMRARGAQVTDIAIIVIAADDNVMPQTIEAINHAQAAGVPIVFAINKIDKPAANPEKVKEELANMNLLVEDWGGKYQSQDISAKQGLNVEQLLEKVLLEAEMLELKANPKRRGSGTIIESELDKGRGYVSTILVQNGTLNVGDFVLAGSYTGYIKAMFNERNQKVESAGPSKPVQILGLNGAPQAGDPFNIMASEREAKEIATKRQQLLREQNLRTQKHITLDEIGRRLAIGNFKEINIIVKGDVDGSIEAISDSLIKLSTDELQVSVIHKAVGQITESDIMLAAASNAVIVGFQVRPSVGARRLAEKEEIEIRLYSIIYDAINDLKDAMEGMLSPEIKEDIIGSAEIKETFKITKVGTVAGCLVSDGKILRTCKVRIIRDGIVIYTGELGSLKRFKDEAKEVFMGMECGLNIDKFNDIKVGDIVEAFQEKEVKRTL